MQHSYEMFYKGSNPLGGTMVYENAKIYGPYIPTGNKNRKYVVILFDDKSRTTSSYARYLMECKINRYLTNREEVDHIDDDCTNDNIDNLQILSRLENQAKRKAPTINVICECCGSDFTMQLKDYNFRQIKRKQAGPYCSRRCVVISLRKHKPRIGMGK